MKKEKLTIVIIGWHFNNENLYAQLKAEEKEISFLDFEYFIISHKKLEEIKTIDIKDIIRLGWKIIWSENKGWDWGGYQQFLRWQKKHGTLSNYYLFLHDDIEIKKPGFIKAFLKKIGTGLKVVGNSLPTKETEEVNYSILNPEILYWAKTKGFNIKSNKWKVVRGSCFFTVRDVVENVLLKMPIRNGPHVGLGNWSVKIFGGLIKDRYGKNVVGYLSSKERESEYIKESFRGKEKKQPLIEKLKKPIPKFIKKKLKGLKAPDSPPGLKLHLGCGNKHLSGYLNIDIKGKAADIKGDILELDFEKESVGEVLMVHVIEHIHFLKVEPFLKRVYKWLKKGGCLILEFPDVVKVSRQMLKIKHNTGRLQNPRSSARGFTESLKAKCLHLHATITNGGGWGWTVSTLKKLLMGIGFKKFYVEKPQFHRGSTKRGSRITAIK